MNNFSFQNPVKLLFGKGQISKLSKEIPEDARILFLYGGGSIKANGVHDQVLKALAGRNFVEFAGVEPNPTYETLMQAVEVCRTRGLDFILAVGGGSVADGAKFIAAAVHFKGEPWDILSRGALITSALPIGVVLTLPATGSEMNKGSVISRKATREKLAFGSPHVFPRFSILDPETTYSLPPRQIANGIIDAFVHVTEQYLTYPNHAPLQDRFAESILLTLIEEGPKTLAAPQDYDARANVMWCATMALNGLIGLGVPQDWATHSIGHELTALHGLDHAQTLAIVLPNLLDVMRESKREKLLQYAERIWGITQGKSPERIEKAIAKTRAFFESLGVSTHLDAYGVSPEVVPLVVTRLSERGALPMSESGRLGAAELQQILTRCL